MLSNGAPPQNLVILDNLQQSGISQRRFFGFVFLTKKRVLLKDSQVETLNRGFPKIRQRLKSKALKNQINLDDFLLFLYQSLKTFPWRAFDESF